MIYFCGQEGAVEFNKVKYCSKEFIIESLKNFNVLALDTETEGFFNHKNKMIMLQLSNGVDSFVIDTRFINPVFTKEIIESKIIIGHNLKFDYKFLRKEGIFLKKIFDTFLAECVLTTGREERTLSLDGCLQKYLGVKLDKSVRNKFVGLNGAPFTETQIVYGGEDTNHLHKLRDLQLKSISEYNLNTVLELENRVCLSYADMEYEGMGFDKEKWAQLALNANRSTSELELELDNLVREIPELQKYIKKYIQANLFNIVERDIEIKWSSPTQVKKVLEDLTGDVFESTEERFLSKYQAKFPFIKKFIDYKKQQKLVTTYGLDFLKHVNPVTGRIHTEFWQIVSTGRISSGGANGVNMQNLPAKIEYRNCFIPEEGKKMVSCDFSGQELRLIAEGSQDPIWLAAFNEGRDLHSEVAAMVFDIDLSEVKNKPDFLRGKSYRDVAKTINFGYGK